MLIERFAPSDGKLQQKALRQICFRVLDGRYGEAELIELVLGLGDIMADIRQTAVLHCLAWLNHMSGRPLRQHRGLPPPCPMQLCVQLEGALQSLGVWRPYLAAERNIHTLMQQRSGLSPIMWAIKDNNYQLVNFLCQLGANLNPDGPFTVLQIAMMQDSWDLAELLIKHGAPPVLPHRSRQQEAFEKLPHVQWIDA